MCDFRGPPHAIQEVETGAITYLGKCKHANGTSTDGEIYGPKLKDIHEPGMYHVAATGAYYAYFDGENWWRDNTKYIFLRTPENEQPKFSLCYS